MTEEEVRNVYPIYTTLDRYKTALEQCWEIATDNSITEENKVKIIRDVSRATLDGEPTTADEYNEEEVAANVPPISVDIDYLKEDEDIAIGASIVKSNREVSGVFMVDGKIKDVDYFEKGEEL